MKTKVKVRVMNLHPIILLRALAAIATVALIAQTYVFPSARGAALVLDCRAAIGIFEVALSEHPVFREFTPELAARAKERFQNLIQEQGAELFTAEEQTQLALAATALTPEKLVQALGENDCSYFEKQSELLNTAALRAGSAFGGIAEMEAALLNASKTPNIESDKTDPRNVILGALVDKLQKLVAKQALVAVEVRPTEAQNAHFIVAQFIRRAQRVSQMYEEGHAILLAKAVSLALDAHTRYLTPREILSFDRQLGKGYAGINLAYAIEELSPLGVPVKFVPANGAAERAGIRPGDYITAIDGTPVAEMDPFDVHAAMRGAAGREIELSILNPGRDNVARKVQLATEWVSSAVAQVASKRVGDVLVVRLESFYRGAGADLRNVLERELTGAEKAVVLDLRSNSGGIMDEVAKIGSLFIGNGVIARLKSRYADKPLRDQGLPALYTGPLIVAINEYSASAAEITAGSLQALGRALIVGSASSYGKGSFQTVRRNGMGLWGVDGAFLITTGYYLLPDGSTPQLKGVESDVVVNGFARPNNKSEPAPRERELPYALEPHSEVTKESVSGKRLRSQVPELVSKLQAKSELRQDKLRVNFKDGLLSKEAQLDEIVQVAGDYVADYPRLDLDRAPKEGAAVSAETVGLTARSGSVSLKTAP